MSKPYRIQVFGKAGCDKCAVLNQRLDNLLGKKEWQDFEKEYLDVETEDGLVAFSEAECVNPQRIPAMLVTHHVEEADSYQPMPNPHPGARDDVCKQSKLYQFLGLQTDYSETGRGVITPKMIAAVLSEARAGRN
jgi:hypothetical protein